MPKICEACEFYSAENTPTVCPKCDKPLKMTFLPPAGQAAAPLPNSDPNSQRNNPGRLDSAGRGINWRIVCGVIIPFIFGAMLMSYRMFNRMLAIEERQEQVAVPGMHISEAARIADPGEGTHVAGTIRFAERFAPNDRSTGTHTYQSGGTEFMMRWERGIVVSVENKGPAPPGMRRSTTTITDDGKGDDGMGGAPPPPKQKQRK